jgi:hypothetical protein
VAFYHDAGCETPILTRILTWFTVMALSANLLHVQLEISQYKKKRWIGRKAYKVIRLDFLLIQFNGGESLKMYRCVVQY